MKPHKHAELIKAWAEGATIEKLCDDNEWYVLDGSGPIGWAEYNIYRIKPEVKPDWVKYTNIDSKSSIFKLFHGRYDWDNEPRDVNLKLTFDGTTNQLKSAEVIK